MRLNLVSWIEALAAKSQHFRRLVRNPTAIFQRISRVKGGTALAMGPGMFGPRTLVLSVLMTGVALALTATDFHAATLVPTGVSLTALQEPGAISVLASAGVALFAVLRRRVSDRR